MRAIYLISIVLLACSIMAVPSDAVAADKAVLDRNCSDDDGNDRCAADVQRRMRANYGLDETTKLMEAGVTVRRAMFVDGYGNDVIAISFIRKPGISPFVEIRSPCATEKDCPNPISAAISQKAWDDVISQSANFDEKLAREGDKSIRGEDVPIMLCLHGWFVVAEAVDAPEIDQSETPAKTAEGEIRSDAEGSCAQGLAVPYAFRLADWALENLPECSSLDSSKFRNTPMMLSYCPYLRGDRLAAADAYVLIQKLNDLDTDETNIFDQFFASKTQHRAKTLARDIAKGRLSIWVPNAQDHNNATVKGAVYYDGVNDDDNGTVAALELTLFRESDDFVIIDYKMGERIPRE